MPTRSAVIARSAATVPTGQAVTTMNLLARTGWSRSAVRAQLDAHRWQRCGMAVVLHNGPLPPDELPEIARLNCGPRAALTAFTAAHERGLKGWERDSVHVLVPGGARIHRPPGLAIRVHWASDWHSEPVFAGSHALAPALALAAGTFAKPRPACGLLAAGVQQRLVTSTQLHSAVSERPRLRHRAGLLHAIADISQGAQALSEIDFARLCRRAGLPEPQRQAIREEPSGRRRYLDAEWVTRSGRRLVVEVDGALHLVPVRWWDDQLRQNELVLSGRLVLRFPSAVVRHEELIVVDQLRRALAW
jgi:hypothetical protein